MIHIDWMIGSGKIDVSGKDQNGNIQSDKLRDLISTEYKEGIQNERISRKVADDIDLKHGEEEIFLDLQSRGELSELNETVRAPKLGEHTQSVRDEFKVV